LDQSLFIIVEEHWWGEDGHELQRQVCVQLVLRDALLLLVLDVVDHD